MRLLLMMAFPLLLAGCASLAGYPTLGTYYLDDERAVVHAIDEPDTVATLSWGDSVVVIDAPLEQRTSDDLFVVRIRDGYGRIARDPLMSDLLFRNKYSHGRAISSRADGRRYFVDEFGDTVTIRLKTNVARKDIEERGDGDVVVAEKEVPKKTARRDSKSKTGAKSKPAPKSKAQTTKRSP